MRCHEPESATSFVSNETHMEDVMKKIFAISLVSAFTLGLGNLAMATPSVGDDALYDLTLTTSGGAIVGTLEVQLTAYDAASDSYNEHAIIIDQYGNTQASDQTVTSGNL